MIKNNKYEKKVIIVIVLIIIIMAAYNAYTDRAYFLKINIFNCITLFIAAVVSYYFVQQKNIVVKRKDMLQLVVRRLQEIVIAPNCYCVNEDTKSEELTIIKRNINNYVSIIEEYGREVWNKEQIKRLKDLTEEYSEVIGNHTDDMEYLKKSRLELKRPMQLMENELSKMLLDLYK